MRTLVTTDEPARYSKWLVLPDSKNVLSSPLFCLHLIGTQMTKLFLSYSLPFSIKEMTM
jgi:hypothetical protein